jgi:hypothetical protein
MIVEKMNLFMKGRENTCILSQIEIEGGCAAALRSNNDIVG